MLAEQCLLADSADGVVQLTVTPRTLAVALENAGEGGWSPDDAESDFVAAVAAVYRSRVLGDRAKLGALKSAGNTDVPFATGFLALSVLAAFHMRTDDERTGRAFYPRLAEMLECELVRSYPAGFDGDTFVELWDELDDWLRQGYGRRLAAPDSSAVRRYIAHPFAHVPLRQVDIERLPYFFDLHGYEPGACPQLDRLGYDLVEAVGPWRQLTVSGQNALSDPHRRLFVVRQVAGELERWDGCRTDPSGTRSATIEVWMEVRRRRAQLYLLARRPQGFPDVMENRELVFEASHEGWYEPVPIGPEDGALLADGLRIAARGQYALNLRNELVLPLTPSAEHAGFVSDRVLRADTECAVLCAESEVPQVTEFLETVSDDSPRIRRDETLPRGWCLLTNVRPTRTASPPPGLERLRVESSLALVTEGGLRLGRRWVWLEGAPARVRVVGSFHSLETKIDGDVVDLDEAGHLTADRLTQPGQHLIEIGNRLRQRVNVLPGCVHPECRSWEEFQGRVPPVAVPPGRWVLVGARACEVLALMAPPSGTLSRPGFQVRWAIQVGAGHGATAIHLHDEEAEATLGERGGQKRSYSDRPRAGKRRSSTWEETIHQVAIRRPQLACAMGCSPQDLMKMWRQIVTVARSHKRRMKKGRR